MTDAGHLISAEAYLQQAVALSESGSGAQNARNGGHLGAIRQL